MVTQIDGGTLSRCRRRRFEAVRSALAASARPQLDPASLGLPLRQAPDGSVSQAELRRLH
eukprot:SAG31_NODE_45240_length_259_cov_1.268750_1_plen_59_part_10